MIRSAYLSDFDDMPFIVGDISAIHHPFNLTEAEADAYAQELRDREARRRPCGFQAIWPCQPTAAGSTLGMT